MNKRGRSSARKPVLPNIAAAGRKKKEELEQNANTIPSKGLIRGRGRGGPRRGQGRGGGGSNVKIVQSEGTFTMGLSENTMKTNRLNDHGTEQIVGKLDQTIGAGNFRRRLKVEADDDEKESMKLVEEEEDWLSTDDQDKILLYEYFQTAFVTGIKQAREMPFVLPQKDLDQFSKLMHNSTKSPIKEEMMYEEVKVDTKIKPSDELLEKYANDKTSDLILLQMPASLDVVYQVFESRTDATVKMEIDEPQPSSSNPPVPPANPQKHCTDGLPSEAEIGKLQVLKNGKMRLIIGNRVMEMCEAIPSEMFETVVQTQTTSNNGNNTTGSMTVLGNIGDSYLCTYNVP